MAVVVTQKNNVIKIGAGTSGVVTNAALIIQAVALEYSAAANAVLQDGAAVEFDRIRIVTNNLFESQQFGEDGIHVTGLQIPTSGKTSMANLYVYIK